MSVLSIDVEEEKTHKIVKSWGREGGEFRKKMSRVKRGYYQIGKKKCTAEQPLIYNDD